MEVKNYIAPASNVWEDVKLDIERRILGGEFTGGERIPSVRALAEEHNISESTAQKALNALRQAGIIVPKRGTGYFVKPYVREQIIAERKKALEKAVVRAIEEAELIDVDILAMVKACVSMRQSRSK